MVLAGPGGGHCPLGLEPLERTETDALSSPAQTWEGWRAVVSEPCSTRNPPTTGWKVATADAESALDEPVGDLQERGDHEGHVAESSAYTRLSQGRSSTSRLLAISVVAASAFRLYRRLRRNR